MSVKHTLGLPFPNLPFLLQTNPDGSLLRLTQSNSIVRVGDLARPEGLAIQHSLLLFRALCNSQWSTCTSYPGQLRQLIPWIPDHCCSS